MLLQNRYEYPQLKRIQTSSGRKYTDEISKPVPSVTTILDKTTDKTFLLDWKRRVGEAEAQRISTESANLGTRVHTALEEYIGGENWDRFGNNLFQKQCRHMAQNMITKGLTHLEEVWGLEVGLLYDGLYAGTSDCVGVYRGRPSIIDFKTSRKIKKREWIENYFLQCAAYAQAHNLMFGTDINHAVVIMVDREGNVENFEIHDDEFEHHSVTWTERVKQYYGVAA